MGINLRSTCKPHFKPLGILTMPSQFVLSLTEIFVNNLAYFSLNSGIRNKLAINWNCLHVTQVNSSLYKKAVNYMFIKFFNSLPNWSSDLVQNKNMFVGDPKSVLMEQSFYLVNDFLDYYGTP